MGLPDYDLGIGDHADAVLVEARNLSEAVVLCPPRTLVLKRGGVVAGDAPARSATCYGVAVPDGGRDEGDGTWTGSGSASRAWA